MNDDGPEIVNPPVHRRHRPCGRCGAPILAPGPHSAFREYFEYSFGDIECDGCVDLSRSERADRQREYFAARRGAP